MTKVPTKAPAKAPSKASAKRAKATAKPASTRTKAAKVTGAAAAPKPKPAFKPTVVTSAQPVVAAPMMRKKELIDTVVARSGIKKRDAKPVIEAMLTVLGSAISEGRDLNLHPMGKLKVNRTKTGKGSKIMICKLRQNLEAIGRSETGSDVSEPGAKDTLAAVDD